MVEFPIQGDFREILLYLEVLAVALMFQAGIIIIRKFRRSESQKVMLLAWGALILSYASVFLVWIIADFYVESPYPRRSWLNVSYIILVLGATFFSYNTERELNYNKHIITIINLGLLGVLIISFFIPFISPTTLALLMMVGFVLLAFIYLVQLSSKVEGQWRLQVFFLFVGVIMVICGWVLVGDWMIGIFGIYSRIVGDLLVIIGMVGASTSIIAIPSIVEFEWVQKIRYLNVIYKSGLSIARYSFRPETETQLADEFLMAGGLTSISQIVAKIIESEKQLSVLEKGNVIILFEYGKYLINILIVDEDLEILRTKLKQFTTQIEFLYEDSLAAWDGNLGQFTYLDSIVNANFKSSIQREE